MNALNSLTSSLFNVLLTPFEMLGDAFSLIVVSGIFGVVCLLVFKQISWQSGIKGTKDKIKGNMIAIRIYQDDLGIVSKSVSKVLLRNVQYLGLNFGPILPLIAPMMLVAAQFVVRYAFEPLPVVSSDAEVAEMLPGEGTLIDVEFKPGFEALAGEIQLRLPGGLEAVSRPNRNTTEGTYALEVVARRSFVGDIEFLLNGRTVGTKEIVAGDEFPRLMQPERVSGFWSAWLWPAENTFDGDSPLARVSFRYPERPTLPFLPDGVLGVLLGFFISTILFGVAILKPFNIQI